MYFQTVDEHFILQTSALSDLSSSTGDAAETHQLIKNCEEILRQLPGLFQVDDVLKKYPASSSESLNTVLVQEMCRYNALLNVIFSSLSSVIKAMEGERRLC